MIHLKWLNAKSETPASLWLTSAPTPYFGRNNCWTMLDPRKILSQKHIYADIFMPKLRAKSSRSAQIDL